MKSLISLYFTAVLLSTLANTKGKESDDGPESHPEWRSVCNESNLTDFMSTVKTFRIIVLTYNRPHSLLRLLKSIENSDYTFQHNNPGWRLILEIRIDGGGGAEGKLVRRIAETFQFSGGEKLIQESQENKGLSGSWRDAWTWRHGELFVILEDDVEVSAHWYRAAVNMWQKYGDREYFGGVGLQNQEYSFAPPYEGNNFTAVVRGPVYFYTVGSSIGSSPHPCHWVRMIQEFGQNFNTCPAWLSCVKPTWDPWWTTYSNQNLLFTLYAAHQDAFAVDHREVGYHHSQLTRADHSTVRSWDPAREREHLPHQPDFIDLNLHITDTLGLHHIKKIWQRRSVAVMRFVREEEEQDMLVRRLEEMSEEEKLSTAVVINRRLQHRASLAPLTLISPGMFELVDQEGDKVSKDSLLLSVLAEVATSGGKVLSLPASVSLEEVGGLENVTANILAGKLKENQHPRLDFLYLDGSYNTLATMVSLWAGHRTDINLSLDHNFLAAFTNPGLTQHPVTWQWMEKIR